MKKAYGKTARVALFMASASVAALSALVVTAGGAAAQDSTQTPANATQSTAAKPADKSDSQEVIVVGARKALKTAQQRKKDSDTIIDSITATDIGAFPDKSVAESLQRVVGITVERFVDKGDTQHLTGEPSGVLIRGLTQVATDFNGRDSFSATPYRGLSFQDVTPELLAGVDVYKNETADLIEGGIAGTVNLRTRTAFDSKGAQLAVSANESYGSLAKQWDPSISGLASNRWDTNWGEFGVLLSLAKSTTDAQSDDFSYGQTGKYSASVFGTPGTAYIPGGAYIDLTNYKRDRVGGDLAIDWQNHDHTMHASASYIESDYRTESKENDLSLLFNPNAYLADPRSVITAPGTIFPAYGTPFSFDGNGDLISGTFAGAPLYAGNPGDANWPLNSSGQNIMPQCYSWGGGGCTSQAAQIQTAGASQLSHEHTAEAAFHFDWNVSDRLKLDFDVQHVQAESDFAKKALELQSYATVELNASGKLPQVSLLAPQDVNLSPGGLSNAANYYVRDVQDFTGDDSGIETAFAANAKYEFGTTWLDSLKVGVRFAQREQDVRISQYNWQAVSNNWTANGAVQNATNPIYPQGYYESQNFGSIFKAANITTGTMITINPAAVADYTSLKKNYGSNGTSPLAQAEANPANAGLFGSVWDPICSNTGVNAGETFYGVGGCYRPQDMTHVTEKISALYGELSFGGSDAKLFSFPVSGNAGLRIVQTTDESTGYSIVPLFTSQTTQCTGGAAGVPVAGSFNYSEGCYLNASDIAFNNGASTPLEGKATHTDFLPSFNFKMKFNDTWQARFGYSRGLSRPDINFLHATTQITESLNYSPANPAITVNAQGNPTGQLPIQYIASTGNPNLKPIQADSFDATVENYFAAVGSVTFDIFYKKFYDYIEAGQSIVNITNNGATEAVREFQPVNAPGGALRGIELSGQRYMDFLPGPWDGLGIQANVTLVSDTGINTTNLRANNQNGVSNLVNPTGGGADGSQPTAKINVPIQAFALEGISDYSYNIALMYDKGPIGARIAYSYRSKYLLSNTDANSNYPIWEKGNGFLDAGAHYKINDHLEFDIDASNILGTDVKLLQQVDDGGDANGVGAARNKRVFAPYSYNLQDKRIQIGLRYKY